MSESSLPYDELGRLLEPAHSKPSVPKFHEMTEEQLKEKAIRLAIDNAHLKRTMRKYEPIEIEFGVDDNFNLFMSKIKSVAIIIKHAAGLIDYIAKIIILINKYKGAKMDADKKTTKVGLIKVGFGLLTLVLSFFKITVPEAMLDPLIDNVLWFSSGGGYLLFSYIQAFFTNKEKK